MLQLCQMAFKAVVTVAVVAVAAVSGHIFACNAPGKWLFLFWEGVTGFSEKRLFSLPVYIRSWWLARSKSELGEKKGLQIALEMLCVKEVEENHGGKWEKGASGEGCSCNRRRICNSGEVNQHGNLIHKLWERPWGRFWLKSTRGLSLDILEMGFVIFVTYLFSYLSVY